MKRTIYEQKALWNAIQNIRSGNELSESYDLVESYFRDYLDEKFYVDYAEKWMEIEDIYSLQQVKGQEYDNDKITDLLFN